MKVNAQAVKGAKAKLEKFEYNYEVLGNDKVDIKVHYCGLCYSNISLINNYLGYSKYPLVPGHDIYPTGEEFKMEDINEAIEHLEAGKASFRVVLKAQIIFKT